MPSVSVSVPGKAIISGEHSVLYGFPVVSMAINQRMEAKITQGKNSNTLKINSNIFGKQEFGLCTKTNPQPWCEVVGFLCKKLSKSGLDIDIKSKILNWGFGSSGALFACVCCGLLLMQNAKISKTDLLKTTLELYFEYNKQKDIFRSGIDIITSILGGVVYYNKNENVISKLDDDIFFNTNIYAVYTGHKTTTDDAVGVAKKTKAYYDVLAKIGKITDKTTLAILHNKKNEFYSLIKENQTQLERLNLVDDDTKSVLEFCKKQNLPAKISGSGLGDCVVVFGKYKNNDKYQSVEITTDNKGLEFAFND